MAFRLPPLNTLRIFDAAARQLSFKLAAEELHLTASAVSHGIQTLEAWLGTELFRRGTRHLALTSDGEVYAPLISKALNTLAEATGRLPGRRATGSLAVSSAPTFARRWLLPRLPHFTEQFPDTRITIETSTKPASLEEVDVAIRMSNLPRPGANWVRLVEEELLPVCSPAFKSQLIQLTKPEILARGPLINVTAATSDWQQWLQATGTEAPPNMDAGLRVDTVQMALDAAIHGLGIAVGRRPLIDDDLESGRLVRAIDQLAPSGSWYWMITKDTNFDRPEVKLFRNWMLSELAAEH
jgi:LysR family transcriptional regulator, glycine cleavage system transcriptional activator